MKRIWIEIVFEDFVLHVVVLISSRLAHKI
jgi:hypothetical protein